MKHVEVLLREHVDDLGRCGDVVRVAPGYARNFLLPRRLAVSATEENKRAMQRRRERLDVDEAERKAALAATVEGLSSVRVRSTHKADESGHLYGSVNATRVAELVRQAGHAVEDRDVRLPSPIKTVGEHTVRIHVHADLFAEVVLEVVAEGAEDGGAAPAAPIGETAAEPASE